MPGDLLADLRVVGLPCDDSGTLWGVTSGFGARSAELITIDRATGAPPRSSARPAHP